MEFDHPNGIEMPVPWQWYGIALAVQRSEHCTCEPDIEITHVHDEDEDGEVAQCTIYENVSHDSGCRKMMMSASRWN